MPLPMEKSCEELSLSLSLSLESFLAVVAKRSSALRRVLLDQSYLLEHPFNANRVTVKIGIVTPARVGSHQFYGCRLAEAAVSRYERECYRQVIVPAKKRPTHYSNTLIN